LEAARNIQQRFTEIVGKAIGTIDQMQEEILEQSANYNNLVNKLKEMVIHEDPPVKRYSTIIFDFCIPLLTF
jgi:hypothetical protein